MPRDRHVERHVRLTLYMNYFVTLLGRFPSIRCQVLSAVIKSLDVHIFNSGANVGEPPRDVLIVADNHVGIAGQCDASDIQVSACRTSATQMSLIPQIG